MKGSLFPISLLFILPFFSLAQELQERPEHWPLAEKGLQHFEERNFGEALKYLGEVSLYLNEFENEDKAKVCYHYAKCLQRITKGDDFHDKAKIYKAYKDAVRFGSGWYKVECEIEMDDWKSMMKRRYIGEIDRVETGDLSYEEVELLIWAARELGFFEDILMFQNYLEQMKMKNFKLYLP